MTPQGEPQSDLSAVPKDLIAVADEVEFAELLAMIEQARARAARAINLELVGLCWNVGAYVSERTRAEGWGNAVIARFSDGSNSSATASSPTGGKLLNPSTGPTGLLRGLRVSRPQLSPA